MAFIKYLVHMCVELIVHHFYVSKYASAFTAEFNHYYSFVIIVLFFSFFITIVKTITLFNCTEEHDGRGIYSQFML